MTWEVNIIERIYHLQFLREEVTPHHTGPNGDHHLWSGGRREERKKPRPRAFDGIFVGKAGQNKQFRIGKSEQ